jgi:peptide chain release factor 1
VRDKLREIEQRFEDLAARLADPAVIGDRKRYQEVTRAYSELEPFIENVRRREQVERQLAAARVLLREAAGDAEMAALAREEVLRLEAESDALDARLAALLAPKDPNDEKDVILEIRSGTGGDEATLFAAELLRMYLRHAERQGWEATVLHESRSAVNGIKEAIVSVEGRGAYSRLKHESGVHRVQRVPETEASGRIHTSAASVAVLPAAEEVEVEVHDKDLRVDTFTASGAGGQHVNRTLSAVRLTHLPSGIVVQSQDQRSQHANKALAMKVLRARLLERAQSEQHEAIAADRRSMVGSGDRSEKIRTYNFPQGRVTDHRVPVTVHRLQEILDGDIDSIVVPVAQHFQAERLKREHDGAER